MAPKTKKRVSLTKTRTHPKRPTIPSNVTPAEHRAFIIFKRFLKRELMMMGITGKFNVVISQRPGDLPEAISKNYNAGKLKDGWGQHTAEYKSKKKGTARHFVQMWRPKSGKVTALDILLHETAHSATAALMKKYGWEIVRKTGVPQKVADFSEGITISFHLEILGSTEKALGQMVKNYEKWYEKSDPTGSQAFGLRLAKAILAAAPDSLADRRLLRDKVAELGFAEDLPMREVLRILEDKSEVKKLVGSLRKKAAA